MSGKIRVTATDEGLTLEQRYLTKTNRLELDAEACIGCGICMIVCPKEAVTLTDASLKAGKLVRAPEVEIDLEKCIMCGTCVVFCPSNALKATTDGEENIPVFEYGVMPMPNRTIIVNYEGCDIKCKLICQEACPVGVIHVETRQGDMTTEITSVDVDEKACIYCKQCEVACPFGLITVEKPFEGIVDFETGRCPDGCMVCVDACPSNALSLDDGEKPTVDQEFCILCSACEQVCPEGAIKVSRSSVACTDVRSGAWFKVLEKLTSPEVLARELGIEAGKKRADTIRDAFF